MKCSGYMNSGAHSVPEATMLMRGLPLPRIDRSVAESISAIISTVASALCRAMLRIEIRHQ